ncbi:sirohydrochlorin cobaltochelatase [Niameybacter massiliensis]|uniref:sirohydrochlorin cobaltochelatase n=1 Tax=Niameybacter massiliensis TaxID=1658108 RepID=UPI0006B5B4DF|nr:sirohydrochlorin cobaltochelatase [Niameybacter massiliensis]
MTKKALLVVSFGTTYEDTRKKTIEQCEHDLQLAFPDYTFFRAYTSRMVIDRLAKRDGLIIPNPVEALNAIYEAGFEEVLIQSLHIICGDEYHKLSSEIESFSTKFKSLKFGRPLLTTIEDYKKAVHATLDFFPELKQDEALILMGHGTFHPVFPAYCALEYMFHQVNTNVYIGTVEGFPTIEDVLQKLQQTHCKRAYLAPFMLVAGDHAINDMAGDELDSWKNLLEQNNIDPIIHLKGLGESQTIRHLFIEHALDALKA